MNYHRTVLPSEVIQYLNPKPGEWYLDATLGDGGHTRLIAQSGGKVWGLDQDQEALARACSRLEAEFPGTVALKPALPLTADIQIVLTAGNFEKLEEYWRALGLPLLNGILFDLGASTLQLTSPTRGFSFNSDAPLDMRMSKEDGVTAADLVNALSERELTSLLFELGGEIAAKRIAKAIVKTRAKGQITTTKQLAELIARVKPTRGRLHPATQAFQALRMAVNRERIVLKAGLEGAWRILRPHGRLVAISFHEGEDATVKHFFKNLKQQEINILTLKPVVPSTAELELNQRARSAKLRAAEKL